MCAKIEFDEQFGDANVRRDYVAVSRSVLAVIDNLILGSAPFGNRVVQIVRTNRPRVLWEQQDWNSDQYRISLRFAERDYCRLAYQLSHELCHVKMGPARSNLLLEVMATAVSLKCLTRLRNSWEAHPPHESWRSFAQQFQDYRSATVESLSNDLPNSVRNGFSSLPNEDKIERLSDCRPAIEREALHSEMSRAWQHAAAQIILDGHILNWNDLLGLAQHTDPSPQIEQSYREDLSIDPNQLPQWMPEWLR